MASFLFYLLTVATILTATVHTLLLLGRMLKNPTLEFYGRLLAATVALFACAFYGTVVSALLNVVGYGGLGQWTVARAFKWSMLLLTGVWFDVHDGGSPDGGPHGGWLDTTRPAVFVGNHQTELDILFLGHIFPKYCSVSAKASLKYVPLLGWFMYLSKTVFIERASRAKALEAFANAAAQMRAAKQSVYIFPEGTRSYYDHADLLPFKKGAFHLAVQGQVPIVPIVVANYSHVLNFKKRRFHTGRIPIRVLEPISTVGKTKDDVDDLLEEVRGKMLVELKKLTAEAWASAGIKEGGKVEEDSKSRATSSGVQVPRVAVASA